MPFSSEKQREWMKINKPDLYKEWVRKYGKDIKQNPTPNHSRPKRDKRPVGMLREINTP